jgi:hypothetical protein
MTPSEKYVSELCSQSFLPFWSFPNPLGKKNKELCDILVVCGPHVVIISVKDITISNHKDEEVQYERWISKAIYDSVEQLYGAERFLNNCTEVILSDRRSKIKLPPQASRIIYRIAIAFGSKDNFPLPTKDFGKGFVHVFNERSTLTILRELDTITDFTNYLTAKERFVKDKRILVPSENDFLAVYLQTNFQFDYTGDLFVCDSGAWEEYVSSDEYNRWRSLVEPSFFWDRMIEHIHNNHITTEISDERRSEVEEAVRYINLECRLNRIELGSVLRDGVKKKVKARMIKPPEGVDHTYVIIPLTDENWDGKDSELKLRCIVARAENPSVEKVIGIAFGGNSSGENCIDVCYFRIPSIDQNFMNEAKRIQEQFGYFKNMQISHSKEFRND